ncbi:alcohol dehydrogenase [Zopfochytrium polystomum]|nr:alcohol dehydrogenase [Zopfochytrium polystomum]
MTSAAAAAVPATMKALMIEAIGKPIVLEEVPFPTALPGTCVVKVLAADASPGTPALAAGHTPFTHPGPFCPATRAVGRVVSVGPDAATLVPGQLVVLETFLRARDDPDVQALWGLFDGGSPASRRFVRDNWTMGTLAQYVRAPLENAFALDEPRLCGALGLSFADLVVLPTVAVGYAGLRAVGVQAGETVVVAPATGAFSGTAVHAAVAMGANVIAMGRKPADLLAVQAAFPAGRVRAVPITGDVAADAAALRAAAGSPRGVDVFLDLSPAVAKGSTHVRSGIQALRQGGRACLMGVLPEDLAMPYASAVWRNLTIKGQYMYERHIVADVIKLAESGVLPLGSAAGIEVVGTFPLEQFADAFKLAQEVKGFGKMVVFTPNALPGAGSKM